QRGVPLQRLFACLSSNPAERFGLGDQKGTLVPGRDADLVVFDTDRQWTVAMVGVGNLGRALLGYRGFAPQGFKIVAAFDSDERKLGQTLGGVPIKPLEDLERTLAAEQVTLGVIAVPAAGAQSVADRFVAAGVTGILNFAPVTLSLPPEVSLVGVDLATELEQLCFSVANRLPAR
ncbi:MAG: redox-sensing transcriptional repressor Rex, partial [Planctomycetota bacterium]